MKKTHLFALSLALILTACAPAFSSSLPATTAATVQGRNSIYGIVFGESRRPLPDVYVELLDDVNSSIRQAKTDASGRFRFSNLVDGRYIIKVRPYGTDYQEQSREVVLTNISFRGGSVTENVDIALIRNPRANSGPFALAPEVIFAQEVPDAAKRAYEQGVEYLRDKKEKEGLASLKTAIELFPKYYQALDRLGAEYASRGMTNPAFLQAGYALLMQAVEINPNGYSSAFGLGWTQYQLGLTAEAITNLKRATSLYPKGVDAYLWLGKAQKRLAAIDQAEATFKRANELTSGKSPEVHWQLAALYNDTKRFKEAADELELFLKYEPKSPDTEKIRNTIKTLREKTNGQ